MVSRVAKSPVEVPKGVDVKLTPELITVKGKLGELTHNIHALVNVTQAESLISFAPVNGDTQANALAGTTRALINNMVKGVSEGFERKLVLVGVGYRAKAQGKVLNLSLGFSHPVDVTMPEGVTAETPAQTEIVLKGADKQQVCQMAANIRALRPPEPYKGKGVRYHDERVIQKEGKKK
jgi:large subunit ribosomal protein L6